VLNQCWFKLSALSEQPLVRLTWKVKRISKGLSNNTVKRT